MAEQTEPSDLFERIVAGVLKELRLPADGPPPAPPQAPAPAPARAPSNSPAAAAAAAVPRPAPASPTNGEKIELADDVITAALLQERGVSAGPIVIGAKSVLTPSAVDFLAERKLGWKRAATNSLLARKGGRWLAIVAHDTAAARAALDTVAQDAAAEWRRERADCHRAAATRAVDALCRGECDALVVFTEKPEAVVCRANRNPAVRAATVAAVARIKSIREQLGANLFAIDPGRHTAFELRSLLRELSATKPAAPPNWNE